MGWASAGAIFDPVARALVELRAPDEMKIRVLGDLIGVLQDGDWDTEDESLEQFQADPAIVEAFRQHDVRLYDENAADEYRPAPAPSAGFADRLRARIEDLIWETSQDVVSEMSKLVTPS